MNHYFGGHLSIAGGYHKAVERANAIGANALQIFSSSPRGWNIASYTPEQKQLYIDKKKQHSIGPVFFHASYLVNLADNERIGKNSRQSLIAELSVASELGIMGSIVHLGSFKQNPPSLFDVSVDAAYKVLIENIKHILSHTPKDVLFIIENAGNNKIGKNLEELSAIVRDVHDERIRICLDTCHMYSAGYDISSPEKYRDFFHMFDRQIGIEKLAVIHVNDSRDPYNSGRDRHENLGQGTLTLEPFRLLVNDIRLKHTPFIIETPGFDGGGPDKKNLDILKSLVAV